MRNRVFIAFVVILLVSIFFFSGCVKKDNSHSLPTSAKLTANNQLTIPFPYTDRFPSATEQWILDQDTSNHFVLEVMYKNNEIATFPVNAIGANQVTGKITLGGKEYSVTSITLNSERTSGQIMLKSGLTTSNPKTDNSDQTKNSSAKLNIFSLSKFAAPFRPIAGTLLETSNFPVYLPTYLPPPYQENFEIAAYDLKAKQRKILYEQ